MRRASPSSRSSKAKPESPSTPSRHPSTHAPAASPNPPRFMLIPKSPAVFGIAIAAVFFVLNGLFATRQAVPTQVDLNSPDEEFLDRGGCFSWAFFLRNMSEFRKEHEFASCYLTLKSPRQLRGDEPVLSTPDDQRR